MTKKTQRELYDLSEVEEFLRKYNEWYQRTLSKPQPQDSNPNDPPPPPPGPIKP